MPGLGRSAGGGNGYPLQYSCLNNSMDRGACWASPWVCKELETTEQLALPLSFDASKVTLVVKNLPANAGDLRDMGSIPGSGRSPGGGHGNTLQCSCLENPMDRGAWQASVHRVTQSQTGLKWLISSRFSYPKKGPLLELHSQVPKCCISLT